MRIWIGTLFIIISLLTGAYALAAGHDEVFVLGKELYERNCARCHGIGARGTEKGPPFLNEIYKPSHHSDMSFQMAVLNGVRAHHWNFGNMPPIDGVSMAEMGMIIKYVRAIQREAGIY